MWKPVLWSLVQSWLLPQLVEALRKEAQKSDTPIDDEMVNWIDANRDTISASIRAAF